MHIIHLFALLPIESLTALSLERRGEISDYVFGDVIGYGGQGYICLATKTATQEEFVAKILLSDSNSEILNTLPREIQFLRKILESDAPNVIKYVDSFTNPRTGKPVLVMEKAIGGNLFDWISNNTERIQNGRIGQPLFMRLMYEAAQSIKQVHDLDICHRDIKPQNFVLTTLYPSIITEEALLKLIDFGIAFEAYDAKGLFGTLEFVSPEYAQALLSPREIESYIDLDCKSTDVYALGVTFYYLLSVTFPYVFEDSFINLYQMIANQSYKIPYSVQTQYPEMIQLLKSMLSTRENRCSLDYVLKFIERLADNLRSGDVKYRSSSRNYVSTSIRPILKDGKISNISGTKNEAEIVEEYSCCFGDFGMRRRFKKVRQQRNLEI